MLSLDRINSSILNFCCSDLECQNLSLFLKILWKVRHIWINREVYNANNPLEFVRRHLSRITLSHYLERVTIDSEIKRNGVDLLIYALCESGINYPSQNWNEDKSPGGYDMEDWVYALNLEEQLFIPEKIDILLEFYEKNPTELALQYRSDP